MERLSQKEDKTCSVSQKNLCQESQAFLLMKKACSHKYLPIIWANPSRKYYLATTPTQREHKLHSELKGI